jgi:hypothetical protein
MSRLDKYRPILLGTWLFLACKAGDGTGAVHGELSIESCDLMEDDFNLGVDFFSATYSENTLTIRVRIAW